MCLDSKPQPLALFEAVGIELEYMIVDSDTLDVLPIADKLLEAAAGEITGDYSKPGISWNNELALHVIEFKTTLPAAELGPLKPLFLSDIHHANALLAPLGAQLMPSAMHPWMDPLTQMHLWPHEYNAIYAAFNKIFDCRGHGWANLQSSHINLPFADEKQFVALHAAIRLILPLLPALAASSPIAEGRATDYLDYRAFVYQSNAVKIPSIAGIVIPEVCRSYSDYQEGILQRIYDDLAPYDTEGVLRYEWSNARGAIARFDRNSIEIRLLDIQESPTADLAIATAVTAAIRALVADLWDTEKSFHRFSEMQLKIILDRSICHGGDALIDDEAFLQLFAFPGKTCLAKDLWHHLISATLDPQKADDKAALPTLNFLLEHGTLAKRILRALPEDFSHNALKDVYRELCACLQQGSLFRM